MESNSSPKLSTPEKTESAADEMAASLSCLSIDSQPISPGGNPHPFCPARNISRNNGNPHHHYHQRPNPNRNPNFNYMRSPNPSFMNRPTSHHNQYYYPRGKYSNPYNHFNNPTAMHQQVIQNSGPQFHNNTTIYHNANPSSSLGQFWLPPPPPPPPPLPLDFSAPFMYGFPIYGGEAEGFSVPRRPNAFIRSPTHNFAGPQWLYERPLPPPIVPNETPLLLAEIRKQIEYYFSNNNLCSDLHLREHMDSEGWVDIRLIAGFNLIVAKTDSLDVIREALRLSESVELQDDRMRKRHGWSEWIWPSRKQETKMTLSKAPSAETR